MELIGELNNTDLTIEIDLHDLKNEMNLTDLIEDGCRDYIDNTDFSDHINIEERAQDLLDQYNGRNDPCRLGESFEKAVWWAMSRQSDENTPTPSSIINGTTEQFIRKIVREELRSILGKTIDAYLGKDEDASTT